MSKVFVDVGMSLDGYIAGPNGRPDNPLGDGGLAIHDWMFRTATFVERLGLPGGGERSTDDDWVRTVFDRAGVYLIGRRMFDEGEVSWPEEAPFRAPVFVLTHVPREPWPRKGGTTFHFVTDGIGAALQRAQAAAGGKDVRIGGGADTIRQFLRAGLVDEITVHFAPLLLGRGLRLFDGIGAVERGPTESGTAESVSAVSGLAERGVERGPADLRLEQVETSGSAHVTHIRYRVLGNEKGA